MKNMHRLAPAIIFAIILLLLLPFRDTSADEESEEPKLQLKLTGTIVSKDSRYVSSAIVDDKIWWEGVTYLIEDGKLKYPTTAGVRGIDKNDLATLVKVENSKVTIEYQGETFTFKAR